MKKYIISTLIIAWSIISFTNASSMECTSVCNIDTENKQGCFLQINSCQGSEGTFAITPSRYIWWWDSEWITDFEYESCQQTLEIQEGYDFLSIYNYNNKNFTLDYSLTCNTNEKIIEWWTEAFSWIIDRLWSIFWEFWPYIIYIAIACLGISLLFRVLKYILWYLKSKSKNAIMNERKTREEDEKRNRQNPYYSKSYDKPQKIKFWSRWYKSRK